MKLYKFTNAEGQTKGQIQWGEGVEHTAPGGEEEKYHSDAYLSAYTDPLQATMMDPSHGLYQATPGARLWEAEGDVEKDDGTMVWCTRLKTLREIPIPEITSERRVAVAIRMVKLVHRDSEWGEWADKWLSGKDRTEESAGDMEAMADEKREELEEAEPGSFDEEAKWSQWLSVYEAESFSARAAITEASGDRKDTEMWAAAHAAGAIMMAGEARAKAGVDYLPLIEILHLVVS